MGDEKCQEFSHSHWGKNQLFIQKRIWFLKMWILWKIAQKIFLLCFEIRVSKYLEGSFRFSSQKLVRVMYILVIYETDKELASNFRYNRFPRSHNISENSLHDYPFKSKIESANGLHVPIKLIQRFISSPWNYPTPSHRLSTSCRTILCNFYPQNIDKKQFSILFYLDFY